MFRSQPRIFFAATCLLAIGLTGFSLSHSESPAPRVALRAGQPYVLDVRNGTVTCDLAFGRATQYVLVLSSLADADETTRVCLESTPVERVSTCPATRLPPLRVPLAHVMRNSGTEDFESRDEWSRRGDGIRRSASSGQGSGERNSTSRAFYLYVTDGPLEDPRQYARVEAHLIGEGDSVRIFLDRQQTAAELAPGLVNEIVTLMDHTIIPETTHRFGRAADVDGDGRFAVLLTPWLERLQGGRTSLGGFVRSGDFRDDLEPPFGSHCDVLYLNSRVRPGAKLHDLLAHEYVHAVCFSQNVPDEEDWLNEAIAHQAEPGRTNLRHRIQAYLAAPHQYPLVVPDYFRAGLWRNHGCRGATFLFLRWCTRQFGDELLRELIHNPVRGKQNLETVTGRAFEDLYRHWSVAMLQSPIDRGETEADDLGASPVPEIVTDEGSASNDRTGRVECRRPAGPNRIRWSLSSERTRSEEIDLRGTATAYVEITALEPGPRRFRIVGPPDSRLQVTVLKETDASLPPIKAGSPRLPNTSAALGTTAAIARSSTSARRSPCR